MLDEEKRNKARKAARQMYFGRTMREASVYADVPLPTLRKWTKTEWWADVLLEVETKYLGGLTGKARRMLEKTIACGLLEQASAKDRQEGTKAAIWVLERRDKMFVSSKKYEHTHEVRGTLPAFQQLNEAELRLLANGDFDYTPSARLESDDEVMDAEIIDEENDSERGPTGISPPLPPGVHKVQQP